MANHFRWMLGVTKPHEIIDAWKPFNLNGLAPKVECPMLILYGEAEAAQSNEKVGLSILRFVNELTCSVTVRMFGFENGWAATHCQIGALAPLQALVFEWLDKAINYPQALPKQDVDGAFDMFLKYIRSNQAKHEAETLIKGLRGEAA